MNLKTMIWSAMLLAPMGAILALDAANAQTVINNNTVIVNNSNNGGDGTNRRGDYDAGQAVNWRNDSLKVEAWLYTDRTNYRPGTGVQLKITLSNYAGKQSIITLPRRGEYAISVVDTRTNRVVWSRDRSQNRGGALRLNNGGTAQYLEYWDQRDAAGKLVPSGAYRIDVRALDILPLSATVFLSDRSETRPQPGDNNAGNATDPRPGSRPQNGQGQGVGLDRTLVRGGGIGNSASASVLCGAITLSKTTVRPGDVVRFSYTVTNPTNAPVALTFGSAQTFDVAAIPVSRQPAATRTPVWRLGEGVMWTQAMQSVSVGAGEQKTFTGSWRIPADLSSGSALDVSAYLTPVGAKAGAVGGASVRVTVE